MERLTDISCKLFAWIDRMLLQKFPEDTVALCFNLYECEDNMWSIELIGTDEFDAEDDDWACDEVVAFRKNPFVFKFSADWEEVLEIVVRMIRKYLEKGIYADKIRHYKGVAVGFVDGDLEIIYQKENETTQLS